MIFVLCTTDPQKILETILSRCQRFDFHRIGNEDIEHRLAYVCEQGGLRLRRRGAGHRGAPCQGWHARRVVHAGTAERFWQQFCACGRCPLALGRGFRTRFWASFPAPLPIADVAELYGLIRAQVEEGNDLLELTRDLVAHVRDVYVACVAGARAELFEGGSEQAEALAAGPLPGEHPADRLARVLTVLDDAALDAYIFNLANKASVFVHLNEGALKGNGEIYYKGASTIHFLQRGSPIFPLSLVHFC